MGARHDFHEIVCGARCITLAENRFRPSIVGACWGGGEPGPFSDYESKTFIKHKPSPKHVSEIQGRSWAFLLMVTKNCIFKIGFFNPKARRAVPEELFPGWGGSLRPAWGS